MKGYQIVICDDDRLVAEQLSDMIKDILKEMEMEAEVRILDSGAELLSRAKEGQIIFLDVDMPEMDGIETGKKLREKGLRCPIIMETAYVERFKEAFAIGALRYITKDFVRKEVEEALKAAIGLGIGSGKMELYDHRVRLEVHQREVSVFRAYNSYVLAQVKGKWFRKEISLVSLEKELDCRLFVRLNKSEIINMAEVTKMDLKKGLVFLGQAEYILSSRNRKNFEEKMLHFDLYDRLYLR